MQGPIDSDDGQEEEKEPEESPHGHALPPPHHETMSISRNRVNLDFLVSPSLRHPTEQKAAYAHENRNAPIALGHHYTYTWILMI